MNKMFLVNELSITNVILALPVANKPPSKIF